MVIADKNVRLWAILYALVGACVCVVNLSQVSAPDLQRFILYLICANVAALGVRLGGSKNLMPAGFLVLLLGVTELSLPELLFIAFTITLLHEVRQVNRISQVMRVLYAITSVTIGIAMAHAAYRMTSRMGFSVLFPAPVIASSFVLLFNCGVATTLLSDRNTPFIGVYRRECRPLLSWFVAAAYLAYLVRNTSLHTGVHPGLVALPILFAIDRGYRAWFDAKVAHRGELEALHLRTLETLAVAIDTRDHTTQMHLRRVQVYAMAVGRELGLNETELQSLNVAALLHDIGKLGIPDHILLKPGSLTVEEWEKMKTHPALGAEMLSRMKYPESILSMVKAHHEKWDGTGYPLGVAGDAIPIGARILSAVDCLDALASDRPYRGALTLQEAMDKVRAENGKSFDPRVIAVLESRYQEMEQRAREAARGDADQEIVKGSSPEDPGKLAAKVIAEPSVQTNPFLDPIVSARQETKLLQQLASDLAQSLEVEEVVASAHKYLSQMVAYDTLAVYLNRGKNLEPVCIIGENSHLFSKDAFPMAKSLSGWAAQNRTAILNGDTALESSYSNDSKVVYKLCTALAVPFEGRSEVTGVLTLYHPDQNAFSRDDLRIVQAASAHFGRAIESAVKYQHAEESAVTDHLTGIPNARSLAKHLERELARAQREAASIGVLVCDLDGFKQVNDQFGHLKGNEVLQLVAKGLRDTCRTSDYLARMGGDEFVIVVPGLKEELCQSYLERLQTVAQEAGWLACGSQCLSISVGTAIYPFDGADSDSLLAEADRRMYCVKHAQKDAPKEVGQPQPEECSQIGLLEAAISGAATEEPALAGPAVEQQAVEPQAVEQQATESSIGHAV